MNRQENESMHLPRPSEFGPVEQSYRDTQIDDELWHAWASQFPEIAEEGIHEANAADREGVTAREAFLRGVKFATRIERNRREAAALEAMFSPTAPDITYVPSSEPEPKQHRRLFGRRVEKSPKLRHLHRNLAAAFLLSRFSRQG